MGNVFTKASGEALDGGASEVLGGIWNFFWVPAPLNFGSSQSQAMELGFPTSVVAGIQWASTKLVLLRPGSDPSVDFLSAVVVSCRCQSLDQLAL